MLKSVLKIEKGREVLDYSLLVPNPATRWIMPLLFEQARATAWGTPRLSKSLDSHPDIPDVYKPFHPQSVGRWLDDPVYYGELWWPRHSTGIVADSVVREKNPEEEILKIPDYCEVLVSRELAAAVQSLRNLRRKLFPGKGCQEADNNGKLITPRAAGMAINYLLSGLLYCGECGLRMTVSSSANYIAKSGEQRRYAAYVCPGNLAGHCSNSLRVPEVWIREQVIGAIRQRLFPRAS